MDLIEYLRLARELTASTDIKDLMVSAKYLQSEMEPAVETGNTLPIQNSTSASWMNVRDVSGFLPTVKLRHPTKGTVPFKTWPYQDTLSKLVDESDKPLILLNMARQMGCSTTLSAVAFYRAITRPNNTILLVGNNFASALSSMDILKFMIETCELPIPYVTEFNKSIVSFNNGSRILARAASKDCTRGLSLNMLIIQEAAFIPWAKDKEFWESIQPQMAQGCQVVMASTPNYTKGIFYELWSKKSQAIDAIHHKVIWSDNPTRDEAWADSHRKQFGEERFKQEFEGKFREAD